MRITVFLGLIALALATGCGSNEYLLELRPDGEAMERKLTCWRPSPAGPGNTSKPAAFPEAELTALKALYSQYHFDKEENRHTFTGRFLGDSPRDIGGAGWFTNYSTLMGRVSIYSERFRGDDDLLARIEKRQQVVDELVDLLIGWFRSELETQPEFERLRGFLDSQFRRDVKNLSLHLWYGATAERLRPGADQEFYFRMAQYVAERGYINLADLPLVLSGGFGNENEQRLLSLMQRLVATRMGVAGSEPLPPSLAFLGNQSKLDESLDRYLRTTPQYQRRLEEWEGEKANNPNASAPKPDEVLGDLLADAIEFELFASSDRIKVALALPLEPAFTNGQWDQAKSTVHWTGPAGGMRATQLPFYCYAIWTQPEEAFQRAHFGKVILSTESLMDYNFWRHGLSGSRGKEWDRFVASLSPEDGLAAKLEAFRFSDEPREPQDDASSRSEAAHVIQLIKAGLQGGSDP